MRLRTRSRCCGIKRGLPAPSVFYKKLMHMAWKREHDEARADRKRQEEAAQQTEQRKQEEQQRSRRTEKAKARLHTAQAAHQRYQSICAAARPELAMRATDAPEEVSDRIPERLPTTTCIFGPRTQPKPLILLAHLHTHNLKPCISSEAGRSQPQVAFFESRYQSQ